ncbi:Gfo/Idh/MocA family oxidoreductase [Paenibacillus eucommiae]|uniref:Gfo/Idh/MocA family oxidoreductase n=1 Tax=Paenibacillus eucommiae TaxID=1355755 RepID=UPI0035E4190D
MKWSYWGDHVVEGIIVEFVQTLRSGRASPMSGEDGMKAAAVAIAAYESSKQKMPIVGVNELICCCSERPK